MESLTRRFSEEGASGEGGVRTQSAEERRLLRPVDVVLPGVVGC